MNRRTFLRGAGGIALGLPFLSSLHEARGSDPTPPRRLVFFFMHNGCITDRWWPALEDGPLAADTFNGTTLEPLGAFYEKLLLPRGFRSMNPYGLGQNIDPHDQAMGSKLTCAPIASDSTRYATAESLDHTVAKQLNPGGSSPLVLSVGRPSTSIKDVLSFSGPGAAFPATVDPKAVYDELIQHVPGSGTGSSEADFRLRRGESVIDIVHDDLASFQKIDMSAADRKHVQAWLDLLRDTEIGVGNLPACSQDVVTKLGVTPEAVTAASTSQDTDATAALATAFTLGSDMMMNLMALSLLCDQKRVAILTFPGYVVFNWDGIQHTHDHSGLSHRTGDFSVGGQCLPGVIDMVLEIDRWYAKKYARLVGLFDGLDEGHGTLLDNSAVVFLNELSDGAAHNLNNLPVIVAGGAGGYLKQGRAVNVEGTPVGLGASSQSCTGVGAGGVSTVVASGSTTGNVPINKFYVTLMNAVGCTAEGTPGGAKVTTFGVFDGIATDSGITDPGEVASLTAAG